MKTAMFRSEEQRIVVGVSWGGFVALRLAVTSPTRIDRLVLMVPAGLVSGSAWEGLTKMGWPMYRYLGDPTLARLQHFLKNLLSTPDDELWRDGIGAAFVAARMDNMRVPKKADPRELASFVRPTLVIAADRDVSFPGAKLLARAEQLFRGPLETELLENTLHSPPTTDAFRARMGARIAAFLHE